MPRYLTVDSSLRPEVHTLYTTSIYAHVATDLLREVIGPLEERRLFVPVRCLYRRAWTGVM
jgi:hypothetical protein